MHMGVLELELFRSSGTLFDLEMKAIISGSRSAKSCARGR